MAPLSFVSAAQRTKSERRHSQYCGESVGRDARFELDSRAALKAFRLIGGFDGIQLDELRDAISTIGDSGVRAPLMKNFTKIFSQFDTDGNGSLDVLEFENMILHSTSMQHVVYELLEKAEDEELNDYLIDATDAELRGHLAGRDAINVVSVIATCFYMVVLAIQADVTPSWIGWYLVELGFLIYFTIEIAVRFAWELRQRNLVAKHAVLEALVPMSIFDIVVTAIGWLEIVVVLSHDRSDAITSVLKWVRICRVGRCARLIRILWYCQGFRSVIAGIISGLKPSLWGIALIFMIVFTWAVFIRLVLESDVTSDSALSASFPNTAEGIVVVFRCMALSADAACAEKPKGFGLVFDLLWGVSEALILIGILNAVASLYVLQATENAKHITQSINLASYRRDIERLQKLDKLLRTLIHPGREQTNPKDKMAAEVVKLIHTEYPEAAARIPNLEGKIVTFAHHIQEARKLHRNAMDIVEAEEVAECKQLRTIPWAKTYRVDGEERLLVDDDASANNSLGLPMAPVGALQVTLVQDKDDLRSLLEDAYQAQQFAKTIIAPNSDWACEEAAGLSGEFWELSRGLCDEAYDPGLKSIDRIEQKVQSKYAGRHERNRDYSRLSLIYDSVRHMIKAIPRLLEFRLAADGFQVVNLENRFLNPHPLGWRDVSLLVKVRLQGSFGPSHHIMEMQLRLRQLAQVCHEGHRFYEEIRAHLPDELVRTILDRLVTDTTLDLGITKSEWLQCLPNKEVKKRLDDLGIPRRCRRSLFDIIDVDGSGTITSSELQEMLLLVKEPIHAHEIAGCHFRVRDIQRQLQVRVEPQLALMQKLTLQSVEECEALLEEFLLKIKDDFGRRSAGEALGETVHPDSTENSPTRTDYSQSKSHSSSFWSNPVLSTGLPSASERRRHKQFLAGLRRVSAGTGLHSCPTFSLRAQTHTLSPTEHAVFSPTPESHREPLLSLPSIRATSPRRDNTGSCTKVQFDGCKVTDPKKDSIGPCSWKFNEAEVPVEGKSHIIEKDRLEVRYITSARTPTGARQSDEALSVEFQGDVAKKCGSEHVKPSNVANGHHRIRTPRLAT